MSDEEFTSDKPAAKGQKSRNWVKPVLLIAVVVALIFIMRYFGLGQKLAQLRGWIDGLGPWGPLVYVLLYIAGVATAMPGAAMTVAGGALFGTLWGTVLVSVASTTGAALAFLIARYLARDSVAKSLRKNERFRKLDRMTEEHGEIMVALTRLVPVFPFNLLNYGFGLTRVPFWTYVFWSWLCMLPGTILYVAGADAVYKAISRGEAPWAAIAAAASMLVILTLVVRHARRKLRQKEQQTTEINENATGEGT